MNQLTIIANELNKHIEELCNKYQINLKGNVHLHTANEETNFRFSMKSQAEKKRKLGGFHDTLLDKTEKSTSYNQKFTDYFSHI